MLRRSTFREHARAAIVLTALLELPAGRRLAEALTPAPLLEDRAVAGVPTAIFRPGRRGREPALVLLSGATARGRFHPRVRRLAAGLARAGFAVYVPDAEGQPRGVITLRTLADVVAVARAAADDSGRVALGGISVGATLALLAAEDGSLRDRVSVVIGLAPWADLRHVLRFATTGAYGRGEYRADPFLSLVAARSLAGGLPAGADREALLAHLLVVADDATDPLAGLRPWTGAALGPAGRAVVDLLANRDPARFDAAFAALVPEMREAIERLSPIRGAAELVAPVELVTAPRDKYFPTAESRALVAAAPRARLTVTPTLDHAVPRPSPRELVGAARFYSFLVRTLSRAAGER